MSRGPLDERPLRISSEATDDLLEIFTYVDERPGRQRALDLLERIRRAMGLAASAPLAGRPWPSTRGSATRGWRVASSWIVYEVDREAVTVLRVLHGARDRDA